MGFKFFICVLFVFHFQNHTSVLAMDLLSSYANVDDDGGDSEGEVEVSKEITSLPMKSMAIQVSLSYSRL